MIERSGDTMFGLHCALGDKEREFLSLSSKPRSSVSLSLASKPLATILVVWPQNHLLRFPGLGLKAGSCSMVIWPTKSPHRFLGLGLKTKWDVVCLLCHKTDGRMKTTRDTCQDLAACFAWK
jgi:hypothetical protein